MTAPAAPAPDLAALVGARICHDLISPLGAIGNGVELLSLSGGMPGAEMALIGASVTAAQARIRFFRLAFGPAPHAQPVARGEVAAILADITRGGRLSVDWRAEGDPPRGAVKLVFLALQCLEAAMPWGGRVEVLCSGGRWRVAGAAAKLKAEPALWAALTGATPEGLTAAQVQFALLPAEAARQGREVTVAVSEDSIAVEFQAGSGRGAGGEDPPTPAASRCLPPDT